MKILHTSDWHLGASEQNKSLRDDQIHFVNQICDIADRENIDIVIIAGDIYDRSVASADAVSLYDMAMEKLCVQLGKKVICIAGNHDSAERLASCSSLLEKAGLHVLGALQSEPFIVSVDDTDFYLLPWFTEEKVRTLYPEKKEDIQSITDAYQVVCNHCRETFQENKRHIAVSHAYIADSETSVSDRAAEIGFAMQVPSSVFDGFDYVALGHIHKPQDVSANGRYSGTPMPFSFGSEEEQDKSVTIINTEDMSRYTVSLNLLHRRKTIEGTFEEVMNYSCSPEEKYGYVRVNVTDVYLGMSAVSQLFSVYPSMLAWSGKMFESETSAIRMTMDEFRELESNPVEIFKSFCQDVVGEEASDHWIQLFNESTMEVE